PSTRRSRPGSSISTTSKRRVSSRRRKDDLDTGHLLAIYGRSRPRRMASHLHQQWASRENLTVTSTLWRVPVPFSRHLLRAWPVAPAITLAAALNATAQTRTADVVASQASQADLSRVHIDNFGRIGAGYYRGAQPQGRDYEDL